MVKTLTLPVGDANCPGGGVETESGLDNGANGATAGDGILEPGEVTSTSYVCNGDAWNIGSITPPPGDAPGYSITALGGEDDDGDGGFGGQVIISFVNGSEGGNVEVFKTGAADPSFAFPAAPAANLGASPAIVAANTVVQTQETLAADAGAGTLYTDDAGTLYVLNNPDDGGSSLVTGLSIAAGATLSFVPNIYSYECANETMDVPVGLLHVSGPCLNAGEIALAYDTAADAGSTPIMQVTCSSYYGADGSGVENNGADGDANNDGLSSGGVSLGAPELWNRGTISANGGSGQNGGGGGFISLGATVPEFEFACQAHGLGRPTRAQARAASIVAAASLFNAGSILANGGAATMGGGGSGGMIDVETPGEVDNSGSMQANGGAGLSYGGGAGEIQLGADDGSLRNSGSLTAVGGSVAADCTPASADAGKEGRIQCRAGGSGGISVWATNGTLVNNASLSAAGGASPSGAGGSGSPISISVSGGASPAVAPGDLVLSGAIDTSGGSGAVAGNAGSINISLDSNVMPDGQQITLYGYAQINVSGGKGGVNGGGAGNIQLSNTYYSTADGSNTIPIDGQYGPGGGVINYADLVARGGAADSGAGTGGSGGYVTMTTQQQYFFSGDNFEQVINAGDIDISGGDAASGGTGSNQGIYLSGWTGVANSGALIARGGNGLAGAGGDNGKPTVTLASQGGPVSNTNQIDASGGAGVSAGGAAGPIVLLGTQVSDSGALVDVGGAASAAEGAGGPGGSVTISSTAGLSSVTVAAPAGIAVSGGASLGVPGGAGQVLIDGWDLTTSWTY